MKENNIISAIKIKINEDIAKLGNGITNNKLMMENIVKLAILLPIIFPNTKSFFPYLNKDIKQATISRSIPSGTLTKFFVGYILCVEYEPRGAAA